MRKHNPPPPPPPPGPTEALPGSPEKLAVLRRRAMNREPLHQEGDVVAAPGRVLGLTRLRNGRDVRTGEEVAAPVDPEEKGSTIVERNQRTPARLLASTLPALAVLGERVRSFRLARELSLGQVSLLTGLTPQALSMIERGVRRQVTLPTLWALADAYRVPLDELVGRDPSRN